MYAGRKETKAILRGALTPDTRYVLCVWVDQSHCPLVTGFARLICLILRSGHNGAPISFEKCREI